MNQSGTTIAMTVLLTLAFRLVVAQNTRAPAADPAVSVKHADLEFCRSVQEHGLEGWMSYFETDAVIGPSNPPVRGKAAIRAIYSKVFARQNLEFQWVPLTGEVFGSGDLGYTTGRAHMSYVENGALKERTSRYVTIWAKQADGTWKVIADFGASDPSPQNVRIECK